MYLINLRVLVLTIIYLFKSIIGIGQTYNKSDYITIKNGLGFRDVRSLTTDSRGFMWIGTSQGVERYDGKNFMLFNRRKSADIYFEGEVVRPSGTMMFNDHMLWINADNKLYNIDVCTNEWSKVVLPDIYEGQVNCIYSIKPNVALISVETKVEILLLKFEEDKFKLINTTKNVSPNMISIQVDTHGSIYWNTPLDGLIKVDQDGYKYWNVKFDSILWYEKKLYITPIFISSKNQTFVFPKSKNEIWIQSPGSKEKKIIARNLESAVYHAIEDNLGNIWFATKRQLLKYQNENGQYSLIDMTNTINENFDFTNINTLIITQNNLLWIATNNGIIKKYIGKELIQNYLNEAQKLWGNEMRSIFQDNKGNIIAYCENGNPGLYIIDSTTGNTSKYISDKQYQKELIKIANTKHLVYDSKNDVIYFLSNQLYSIDTKSRTIKLEYKCDKITESLYHNPMTILSNGKLVFGARLENVVIYDPGSEKSQNLLRDNTKQKDVITECFVEDKRGNIWIGTDKGLYIVDSLGSLIHHINTQSNPSLNSNHILDILIDHNGYVWLGTYGGGVNYIHPKFQNNRSDWWQNIDSKTVSIDYISTIERLCNDNVTGLLEDNSHNIWISTYNGLALYNPSTQKIQNFDITDGITNNEFNYTSALKDREGNIWFGGMNGLNKINPNAAFSKVMMADLVLLNFSKYNRKSQQQTVQNLTDNTFSKPFFISPYDNWFQFNWSLPNFASTENNKYFIKMEGLDNDWNFNGNNTFIRYNNLSPGKYTLYIKGSDSKGNWANGLIIIPIIVQPFIWQMLWFKLLTFFIFLGITYLIFRYLLNKRVEMERLRTKIASDLHDEVGSMLSGLAMQSDLLASSENKDSSNGLENIAYLSRAIIGKMRNLVWSIDSRQDSMDALVDRMEEQATDLLLPLDITFKIVVGEYSKRKHLPVNIRQQLFMIFNEAITNIIRHSDATDVKIRIGNFDKNFELSILDNGQQKSKFSHSTGMGIKNMHMRTKMIGAKLQIERGNGYLIKLIMDKL